MSGGTRDVTITLKFVEDGADKIVQKLQDVASNLISIQKTIKAVGLKNLSSDLKKVSDSTKKLVDEQKKQEQMQ